jgi:hypothetical protein
MNGIILQGQFKQKQDRGFRKRWGLYGIRFWNGKWSRSINGIGWEYFQEIGQ